MPRRTFYLDEHGRPVVTLAVELILTDRRNDPELRVAELVQAMHDRGPGNPVVKPAVLLPLGDGQHTGPPAIGDVRVLPLHAGPQSIPAPPDAGVRSRDTGRRAVHDRRPLVRDAIEALGRAGWALSALADVVEEDEVGMSVEDLAAAARVVAGDVERLAAAMPAEPDR